MDRGVSENSKGHPSASISKLSSGVWCSSKLVCSGLLPCGVAGQSSGLLPAWGRWRATDLQHLRVPGSLVHEQVLCALHVGAGLGVCAPCTLMCISGVWAGHAPIEGQWTPGFPGQVCAPKLIAENKRSSAFQLGKFMSIQLCLCGWENFLAADEWLEFWPQLRDSPTEIPSWQQVISLPWVHFTSEPSSGLGLQPLYFWLPLLGSEPSWHSFLKCSVLEAVTFGKIRHGQSLVQKHRFHHEVQADVFWAVIDTLGQWAAVWPRHSKKSRVTVQEKQATALFFFYGIKFNIVDILLVNVGSRAFYVVTGPKLSGFPCMPTSKCEQRVCAVEWS